MREGAAVRTKKPLRLQRQPRGSRWNLHLGFGQRGGAKAVGRFGTAGHRARLVPGTIFGTQPEPLVACRALRRAGRRISPRGARRRIIRYGLPMRRTTTAAFLLALALAASAAAVAAELTPAADPNADVELIDPAARPGDGAELGRTPARGVDVDPPDRDRWTAPMHAAAAGQRDALLPLPQPGASAHTKSPR